MHTITLVGRATYEFTFPGAWDELPAAQLPAVATTLASELPEEGKRFLLLIALAGIDDPLTAKLPAVEDFIYPVVDENGTENYRLLPQLDWLFGPVVYAKSLLPTLTHNGRTYRGPDHGLDHCELNQYIWCTQLLNQYSSTKEPEHLDHFMGAAYQPEGTTWSNAPIEEYAAQLSTLPLETKLAALLNFRALHSRLPELYPLTFEVDPSKNPSQADPFAMVFDLCGPVFGDLDRTRARPLHDVLGYTEHKLFTEHEANNTLPIPDMEPETAEA